MDKEDFASYPATASSVEKGEGKEQTLRLKIT
jgi:hypothetical protein